MHTTDYSVIRKEIENRHPEMGETFLESSDRNIVFLSVPIIILSLANSNCSAFNFSAPSTAALMAAIFTKLARSAPKDELVSQIRNSS